MVNNMCENGKTPLERAIKAAGGRPKDLADLMGFSQQRVHNLKKRGGKLPVRLMKEFVKATGLTKEQLYPDLFPQSDNAA